MKQELNKYKLNVMKQSELVEMLVVEKNYKGLNPLWYYDNKLNEDDWHVELCKVQKWLRDDLDFYLEMKMDCSFEGSMFWVCQEEDEGIRCEDQSYERALEKGIIECLTKFELSK